jgi:hypothetical protein
MVQSLQGNGSVELESLVLRGASPPAIKTAIHPGRRRCVVSTYPTDTLRPRALLAGRLPVFMAGLLTPRSTSGLSPARIEQLEDRTYVGEILLCPGANETECHRELAAALED